ncbi:MAG: PAS domain S-box protein, partial [Bacteroidota bacterium]|nr:PAS domain S-box protein [Bacteroidota bacterium]
MLPDLFKIKRSDVVVIVCFLIYAISFKLIHNITPQTVGSIPIFIISFAGVKLGIKKGLGYALIGAAISWLLYYSVQYNHFSTLAITSVVYILFGGFSGYIHMLKEKVLQKNGTLKKEMEMRAQFEKELQLIKDDLEDKVEIRTSELTAVNKLLKNEIENRELVEQKLNSRLKFEILISEVAQKFANVLDIEEIDDLINTTLKDLTDFIGFDRGYIFFKEEGSPVHIRKYFYHKENIPNGLSTPMIDISEYQVLGKYVFLENQILFSENQRDSSYKDEVAKLLEKFGVNAIIVSAVQFKDRPVGFIGFDQALKRDTSNPVDLIFIKSIEKIIEGAIGKKIIFDELRTNKKRFENISNIIADFAFSINVVNGEVGSLEWVTDAFFIKTGYSKSKEMFEKGWQDVIYSEDLSKLYESFTKAINKKSVVDELRMITFNGSVRWFKFFIEPEFDAEGDVNKIIGGAQDITLQKTFDDILLQNEKKFHLIFDNNPFPMMLVDSRSLDILEINSSAVIQYGYTKEELLTMNYSQFYLDEDKTANIAELSDPHKSFSDPNLVKHLANDNKVLVVETYSHKMLFDNKSVFLVIPLDVTEKIKIANENKLLAHSIKSIQECVSITDEKNTIIYVNDAFCKTYGYESCELVGKNISILHGSSVPTDYSDKVAVKTLEEGYRGEFLNRKKNGIEFPISLTTSNVKDENGEILALIGVATDISDRKENEKALLDAANYAQLEKAKTETIIKSIGESVRIVDLKFNISYQNEICEEHFSIKSGKPCYSLFNREKPCEDCPLFVSNWDGHILHREKVIDSKDTTRYYDLTISALKDSAGNITSVIELAKETTAKKEIELSLKEKVSQLELISGLIFGFKDIFNIKSLIKYIYDVFPEYIPNVDGMSVQLYDSGRDELYGAKNLLFDDAEYRKKSTNKISFTNLAGRCFLESKPIYIEDCKTSSLNDKGYFLDNKIISTVMVPLAIKQKKIGVLRFDNKNKVNAFSHNDIEYFQVIAEQLAMLIENDKLIEGIKNSEKELADSKDYLNNMINALRMGVIAIEPETHTVVDINKYAVELIGAPREYLLGKMCHKFICPAERDKCPVTDLHQEVDSSERILLNYKNEKIPILKSVVPITYKEKKYLV